MAGVQLGGLASGMDTQALVQGLVRAESLPMLQLQARQKNVDAATTTLNLFSSRLSSLRAAAAALADPTQFSSFVATSSDASVAASVVGSPAPGSYSVQVSALAREQRTRSDAQASSTSALGLSGSLDMTIDGATTTVSVAAGDSLTDIASKIRTSGARASASVIFDGQNYMLAVTGLDTGQKNAIAFTENGFSLGLNKAQNTYQTAQDAALTVDGIAITRSTNSITGVIDGVTLALAKTTSGPVTVTAKSDPTALSQKISAFVSAYNAVVSAGQTATGYGSTKAENAELAGDGTLRGVLSRMSGVMASAIPNTVGKFTTLASVGVRMTREGLLTFDQSKLSAALAEDPGAVSRVFVKDGSNGSTGAMTSFTDMVDLYTKGPDALLQTHIQRMRSISRRMGDQVMRMQKNIDAFEARLIKQFTAMETAVSAANLRTNQLGALANLGTNTGEK